MKKLVIAFAMVLGLASAANAQTGAARTTTKPVAVKATTPVVVKPATAVAAKPTLSNATTAKPAATATKVKADGTPDMRFKTNKAKAPAVAAGPKKADGTPDMRFKANKAAKKP